MSRPRQALGDQAIHLIKETAIAAEEVNRNAREARKARRARIEAASRRPSPGTSDLLGSVLEVHTSAGIDNKGKLRAVDTYDLLKLAPIHLKRDTTKGDV